MSLTEDNFAEAAEVAEQQKAYSNLARCYLARAAREAAVIAYILPLLNSGVNPASHHHLREVLKILNALPEPSHERD